MYLYRIESINLINYLEAHKVYPKYEDWNYAYFKQTLEFRRLLEDYNIEQCQKNYQK